MDNQRERMEAFLQLATEELGVATGLVEEAPRQCAYLLQQAAEKMARAILTAVDVQFGPGHNLGQMAGTLREGLTESISGVEASADDAESDIHLVSANSSSTVRWIISTRSAAGR